MQEKKIKTETRNTCPACGESGVFIHNNLKDRIFDTPGLWSIRKCQRPYCGTLWLDPMPAEESIPLLYASYSTHSDAIQTKAPRNKNLEKMRNTLLYQKFGYGQPPSFANKLLKLVMYIHPAWKDIIEAGVFYIPLKKDGSLLDIGCGSGSSMVNMQKRGWKVVGFDFDPKAVENAQAKGLEAYHGDLYSQNFKDNSFDAALLSHVIEHVPSPSRIIKECHRILKNGGTLSVITPNAASWGHKFFGRNWRGLETPQHLQVFSPASLAKLASDAGFKEVKSFSSPHGDMPILQQSIELARREKIDIYAPVRMNLTKHLIKHFFFFLFGWLNFFAPNRSEIAVLICKK